MSTYCPECGNTSIFDRAHCSRCGEDMRSLPFCHCGYELWPSQQYCPKCGCARGEKQCSQVREKGSGLKYVVISLVLLAIFFIRECNLRDEQNTIITEEEAVVLNLPNLEEHRLVYPIRLEQDGSVMKIGVFVHGGKMPRALGQGDKIKVRVSRWKDTKNPRLVLELTE